LYGGYTVISGVRSSGEFIAFLAAVFLMYEPFKKLTRVNATIQQGLAGAQRIFEILDTKPSVIEPTVCRTVPKRYDIELRDVSYEYPARNGGDEMSLALENVSLVIPEGKKVALVGFSGAGKSTMVDLIPRFIDPSRGSVFLGGVDLRELSLRELRGQMAMVGHTHLPLQ